MLTSEDPFIGPGSSFYQLLLAQRGQTSISVPALSGISASLPHGTTVLALRFSGGVVMAGDRRATEGYSIAERDIRKVHAMDRTSAMAFAGTAGPCMEFARLFRIELEHYEKLEGVNLTLEGKANKLAQMIRGNFPLALQGLIVVPIFSGYDAVRQCGRIFKYDIAGGQYEEQEYCAVGSGGKDAKGTLKKRFKKNLGQEEAIFIAVESLCDAADSDVATGGADMLRDIYPTVTVLTAEGVSDIAETNIKGVAMRILEKQKEIG